MGRIGSLYEYVYVILRKLIDCIKITHLIYGMFILFHFYKYYPCNRVSDIEIILNYTLHNDISCYQVRYTSSPNLCIICANIPSEIWRRIFDMQSNDRSHRRSMLPGKRHKSRLNLPLPCWRHLKYIIILTRGLLWKMSLYFSIKDLKTY